MPRVNRPPLASCRVAAIRARTAGCRFITFATNVPTVSRSVTIAAAEAAPDELSTIANVMVAPPMPFIPPEAQGKLIIIALIPLALKGVAYRAIGAGALLRRNLMIYGLGGIIIPFIGIKAIDLVVAALHLA